MPAIRFSVDAPHFGRGAARGRLVSKNRPVSIFLVHKKTPNSKAVPMMKSAIEIAFCLCLCWQLLAGAPLSADDWTRFRGPNGSGVDASVELPIALDPQSAQWQTQLAGSGHSSPVVWKNNVFITSYLADRKQLSLESIDLTAGQRSWQWTMPLAIHPMHRLNNPAASTPAVDAQNIYLLATEPGHLYLIAISHEGQEKWRRDFGPWVAQHGFGTSPIVVDGTVVFVDSQEPAPNMPQPGASRMIAVSANDGSDVWETPLAGELACYGVPIVVENPDGGHNLIGSTLGEGVFAVDLKTGRLLWKQPCFEQRIVGSPILAGDLVLDNNGSGGGGKFLVAFDLAKRSVRYKLEQSISYVPTLLAVRDRLYIVADNGVASCYSLNDGELVWRKRLSDGFWSSPVSDGRHVFCLDKNGKLFVVAASDTFQLVGSFDFGEPTQATPAISDGHLLVRTASKLFCFGGKE